MISNLTFPEKKKKKSKPETTNNPVPGRSEWAPKMESKLETRRTHLGPLAHLQPQLGVSWDNSHKQPLGQPVRSKPETTTRLTPRGPDRKMA